MNTIQVINGGLLVKRSYTTEIVFTQAVSGGMIVNFSDVQQLRDVLVYGIEIFTSETLTKSKSGATVISSAQAATILMTFYDRSKEKIYQQPANAFVSIINGGMFRMFDALDLNLTKSYAQGTDVGVLINQSLVVSFYYLDKKLDLKGKVVAPVIRKRR